MPDISEEIKNLLVHYNQGLELYRARRWDDATAAFSRALECVPDDGPSKLYIARCKEYKESPPSDDWDGVYEAKTK
jgi:hypothetical protein